MSATALAEQTVVHILGIRHHGPGSARSVVRVLDELQPTIVLVELPADCERYERIVMVFNGDDDDALAAARGAWADCKTRGFDLTYWQTDERGRWQRKQ